MSKPATEFPAKYSTALILLHWSIAVLIVAMIPMGKILAGLDPHVGKLSVMKIHAGIGILILALSLVRLIVHVLGPRPPSDPGWPGWMRLSSKLVHWLLIAVSLLIVASGLASFLGFGFFELVQNGQTTPWPDTNAIQPLNAHRLLVNLLMALVVLHTLAALNHQLIRRDNLLGRMWLSN